MFMKARIMGRISLIPCGGYEKAGVGIDAPLRHFIEYGNVISGRKDPILMLKNCPALIVKNKTINELKKLRELVKAGKIDLDIDFVGSSERCYFVNIVTIDSEKVANEIFETAKGFLSERKIPSSFSFKDLPHNAFKKLLEKIKDFFEDSGYKVHRKSGCFDPRGYESVDLYVYKSISVDEVLEWGTLKTIERTEGFILEVTTTSICFVKEEKIDFIIDRRSLHEW